MKEEFNEPCDTYYKIFTNKIDAGYKYKSISPFEFKNVLIKLARKNSNSSTQILNAGRGNPNFFSTVPRYAFAMLTIFSTALGSEETETKHLGLIPKKFGIYNRLHWFLQKESNTEVGMFLINAIKEMKKITGMTKDELVSDLVNSTIGCLYPSPPRVQNFVEPVLKTFLSKYIYDTDLSNSKIFPTEGASASIIYVFNSLKYNHLVVEKDVIGILTPIFSPYLEIPGLENYNLVQVCIKADPKNNWEIPVSEIQKIANPKMKALFIVNPTNPSSLSLSKQTVRKISKTIKTKNPNLIVIADNVYSPFVNEFNTFVKELPRNTIGIYSFSKYFGTTGSRLGVITINNDNIIDKVLLKQKSHERYSMVTTTPEKIKFIDRILLDSREVAEGHTAGLSTPQQVMMTLYAMHDYLDKDRVYSKNIKKLLKTRMNLLLEPIKYTIQESDLNSNYYVIIDILKVAYDLTGDQDFANYLRDHKNPLEFLMKLASKYFTILLPAIGFAGPFWGVRVSIANLETSSYDKIGNNLKQLVLSYYKKYKKHKS